MSLRKVITTFRNDKRKLHPVRKLLSALVAQFRNPYLTGNTLKETHKLLEKLCTILNKSGIEYWAEGGTLLGIIRENRLLPWDHDVDLSVNIDDTDRILNALEALKKQGYRLEYHVYKSELGPFTVGMPRILKIRNTVLFGLLGGDAMADIFFKKEIDGQFFWTTDLRVIKSTPSEMCKNNVLHEFNNHHIKIPSKHEEYLTYRYGKWREPVKEYNRQKDDRSIVKIVDKN